LLPFRWEFIFKHLLPSSTMLIWLLDEWFFQFIASKLIEGKDCVIQILLCT
jgi:hypothetical protein